MINSEVLDNEYTQDPDDEANIISIMVCTDTHIGYKENHPIIGQDSFNTLTEILEKSIDYNVDFLIHGGDFFDNHKLSKETLIRSTSILQEYIFGDRQHNFKIGNYSNLNLKNPNLQVRIPIFMIHGNHDDPSGLDNLSHIDLLQSIGFVNYFGKINSLEEIVLEPILIMKGDTRIALYGIGYIKDQRLHLALENKKLKFKRPQSDNERPWYYILVIHQTKYRGAQTGGSNRSTIKMNMFPDFLNIVIWGHEHECIPTLTKCAENGVYFLFAGSSIVTSLIEAEAKPKHIFNLQVYKNSINLEPIPLQTSRPLLYNQLNIKQFKIKNTEEKICELIQATIDDLLDQYEAKHKDDMNVLLPLLRLKVDYTDFQAIKTTQLCDYLKGKIANHEKQDFLKFYKSLPYNERRNEKIQNEQNDYIFQKKKNEIFQVRNYNQFQDQLYELVN